MVGQLYPKGATKEEPRKCVSMVETLFTSIDYVLYPTNEELLVWLFIVHVFNSFGSFFFLLIPDPTLMTATMEASCSGRLV